MASTSRSPSSTLFRSPTSSSSSPTHTVTELLEQASLASPIFKTRFRWDATRSLQLLRFQKGKKVPPQIQRTRGEDLLASVFPQAAACFENIEGDIEIPNHPLVREVMKDVLGEAMDLAGLIDVIAKIQSGEIKCVAVDSTVPSVFSHGLLNANPYAFLDDAPIEERRARAVNMRGMVPDKLLGEAGRLDPDAIRQVREESWPDIRDEHELHDLLYGLVVVPESILDHPRAIGWRILLDRLLSQSRAKFLANTQHVIAAEREADHANLLSATPDLPLLQKALHAWLNILGPQTAHSLAQYLGLAAQPVFAALVAMESQGTILRGEFEQIATDVILSEAKDLQFTSSELPTTPDVSDQRERTQQHAPQALLPPWQMVQWCERRLLQRIHKRTIHTLRKQIEPVAPAQYMDWLLRWQHLAPQTQLTGEEGVLDALRKLEGFEAPAIEWETHTPPAARRQLRSARARYPLHGRCRWLGPHLPAPGIPLAGKRRAPPRHPHQHGAHHFLPARRRALDGWLPPHARIAGIRARCMSVTAGVTCSRSARASRRRIRRRPRPPARNAHRRTPQRALGARRRRPCHRRWLRQPPRAHRSPPQIRERDALPHARNESARPQHRRPLEPARSAATTIPHCDSERTKGANCRSAAGAVLERQRDKEIESAALVLLWRYGIVFRDLVQRETTMPRWRELLGMFRRLEARGIVRGGRFVSGFQGEQFALPQAVESLRESRKQEHATATVTIAAADPANLVGIVVPGDRPPATAGRTVQFARRPLRLGHRRRCQPKSHRPYCSLPSSADMHPRNSPSAMTDPSRTTHAAHPAREKAKTSTGKAHTWSSPKPGISSAATAAAPPAAIAPSATRTSRKSRTHHNKSGTLTFLFGSPAKNHSAAFDRKTASCSDSGKPRVIS